ncbi:hypothetical protein Y590_19965 [Methylobacterium sp. AMS5]|nr:hypothetical protein Y590_19965 [Methylobacterium sp. AMS5]
MPERGERAHDRRGVRALPEAAQEGPIDLDRVEREAAPAEPVRLASESIVLEIKSRTML